MGDNATLESVEELLQDIKVLLVLQLVTSGVPLVGVAETLGVSTSKVRDMVPLPRSYVRKA